MRVGKRADVPGNTAALWPRFEKCVHGDGNHGSSAEALKAFAFGGQSVRRCRSARGALCGAALLADGWSRTALRGTSGTAALRGAARLSRKRAGSPPFPANAVKQRCLRRAPRFPCRAQKGRSGRAALRLAPTSRTWRRGAGAPSPQRSASVQIFPLLFSTLRLSLQISPSPIR